ncbi:MAG TPA: hypothetical protein VN363_10305 [Anaerolineales bacterium]|nr:hypothetical protein [Anaerolineales bacterium]
MQISEVLSKAWNIIWKHKVLWIFGILVGFSGGNTTSSYTQITERQPVPGQFENFFSQFEGWQIALFILFAVLVVVLLTVLVVFLGTMGRIGLIRGASQADRGATKLTFGELFNGGLPYFWRIFGLNLIVSLAFAIAIILILLISIPLAITIVGLLCVVPMLLLLAPLGFLVNVVVEQSNNAIVIEGKSMMDGLRRGWDVVSTNLGQTILLGLILMLISWGVGFVIGLPYALALAPWIASMLTGADISLSSAPAITIIFMVAYLPIILFLNGILQGYIRSAWTLAFLRFTSIRSAILEPNSSPVE